MTLKLTFNFYPTLHRCSYVVYKIIISVLLLFISFRVYAINFVPISLKTFYSANLYMSLNTSVNIRDLSCLHMCRNSR